MRHNMMGNLKHRTDIFMDNPKTVEPYWCVLSLK